jgi:glycosyltransferase involved in cell wall biosynthesis
MTLPTPLIAVVIPCFRVRRKILSVIENVGLEVGLIVVVDDACPEHTGALVEREVSDPRVQVVRLTKNQGVGGAVLAGYQRAVECGATVIVKVDGDGQMDPTLIPRFVAPILNGEADYTKGNRFFNLESLRSMPSVRLIGNAGLSFITKLSTGYWKVMDPTNGFTAIHAHVAKLLPAEKLAKRYFFESDILFRLNTLQAVVWDIPMDSKYEDEESNLRVRRVLLEFPTLHLNRFVKRIFYNYFLRDFNAASLHLVLGISLTLFGAIFGVANWIRYSGEGVFAPTGTVVLATLQLILGVQFLLSWINFDVNSQPLKPLYKRLGFVGVSANSDEVRPLAEANSL